MTGSVKSTSAPTGFTQHPVLALGFRPFYLVAAIFALLSVPAWMGIYSGLLPTISYLNIIDWHSHEMIFGFFVAVAAGFLLTAVRNWTGLPTPVGKTLLALAALWFAGRALMIGGAPALAAAVDLLFLPALAVSVAIPIMQSGNARNYKVLLVLGALTMTNIGFHLARLELLPVGTGRLSIMVALDIIVILMAVMAGRVIPAFIKNAIPGSSPRNLVGVEVLAFGSLLLILVIEIGSFWWRISGLVWSVLFFVAAASHLVRLLLWQPLKTRRNALLWMLPAAYAWIPIAIFLRGAALLSYGVPVTSGIHALTAGAMASLMVAMMTRSALGHSGRPLKAGMVEISSFLLLQAAAIMRVVPILIWPRHYQEFLIVSAILWTAAFAVFLAGYWPILTRPRIDGKPG